MDYSQNNTVKVYLEHPKPLKFYNFKIENTLKI